MSKAVRLTPSLRERVWGKTDLSPWFPPAEKPIGEVWFAGDSEAPLLVKLLFTSERLSVQVHPADGEAGPRGKTEMWHILEAQPDARIAIGFKEPLTRDRLWEVTRSGEIVDLLNWMPVKAGETYLSPAHTVHAIGGGIVLWEIQQNSDVTYRLWDYGRPREVHLKQAVPICDLGVHPGKSVPKALASGDQELARCPYFVTDHVRVRAGARYIREAKDSELWVSLKGCGRIADAEYRAGEVWRLPETGANFEVLASTDSEFLRTYSPR